MSTRRKLIPVNPKTLRQRGSESSEPEVRDRKRKRTHFNTSLTNQRSVKKRKLEDVVKLLEKQGVRRGKRKLKDINSPTINKRPTKKHKLNDNFKIINNNNNLENNNNNNNNNNLENNNNNNLENNNNNNNLEDNGDGIHIEVNHKKTEERKQKNKRKRKRKRKRKPPPPISETTRGESKGIGERPTKKQKTKDVPTDSTLTVNFDRGEYTPYDPSKVDSISTMELNVMEYASRKERKIIDTLTLDSQIREYGSTPQMFNSEFSQFRLYWEWQRRMDRWSLYVPTRAQYMTNKFYQSEERSGIKRLRAILNGLKNELPFKLRELQVGIVTDMIRANLIHILGEDYHQTVDMICKQNGWEGDLQQIFRTAGRREGKTWGLAAIILMFLIYIPKILVMYLAPTWAQVKIFIQTVTEFVREHPIGKFMIHPHSGATQLILVGPDGKRRILRGKPANIHTVDVSISIPYISIIILL